MKPVEPVEKAESDQRPKGDAEDREAVTPSRWSKMPGSIKA